MKCAISRCLIVRLQTEAGEAGRHEICGLLLGEEGTISHAVPIANAAQDPARSFLLDPEEHLRAAREARKAGLKVVGHYHSHPSGDAFPSTADAQMAGEDGRYWLILGGGEARLWRSRAGGAICGAFDLVEVYAP